MEGTQSELTIHCSGPFLAPSLNVPSKTDVLNLLPSAQGNVRRGASTRKSKRPRASIRAPVQGNTLTAAQGGPNLSRVPPPSPGTTRVLQSVHGSVEDLTALPNSGPPSSVSVPPSLHNLDILSQHTSPSPAYKDHGIFSHQSMTEIPSRVGKRTRTMSIASNTSWAQRRRERFTNGPMMYGSMADLSQPRQSLDEGNSAPAGSLANGKSVPNVHPAAGQWAKQKSLSSMGVGMSMTEIEPQKRSSIPEPGDEEETMGLHEQYSYNVTFMQQLRLRYDLSKAKLVDFLGQLSLKASIWNGHLKTIEGKFGTGVVSYFVLLRGMLWMNLMLFLPILCFMIIPQWSAGIEDWRNQTLSKRWFDHFADTLTGGGYLDTTPLFFSAYSSGTVGNNYKMPEAFFYTSVSVMVISFIIISRRTYFSYKESLAKDKENFHSFTSKIFGGWDYSVANDESARVKSISIHKNLLEEIANEKAMNIEWTTEMKLQAYSRRIIVNVFIFSLLTLASLAIYYASDFSLEAVREIQAKFSRGEETSATLYLKRLAVSLTIALFDVAAPVVFGKLAEYEQWRTPRLEVKYTLYRTIFLKLSSLAVLMVSLFVRISGCETNPLASECSCWESVLAQEIWQLSIVSFIFIAFSVLVGQFVWRLLWERYKIIDTIVGPPEFQIAKYILELIFMQALVWLGYYFSPGMPLIVFIQLFLLFYVQMYSLFFNLRPSHRHYRAGSDDSLQLLMLATLLLVLFPLGYAFVTITPSRRCGPFRNYSTTFAVTKNLVESSPEWVISSLTVIFSSVVLVPLFIVFLLIVLFYYARQKGQRERAHVLKEHLIVEGKDKQFLVAKVASQQGIIHSLASRLMDVQKRLLDAEEAYVGMDALPENLPDVEGMLDALSFDASGDFSETELSAANVRLLQSRKTSSTSVSHSDTRS